MLNDYLLNRIIKENDMRIMFDLKNTIDCDEYNYFTDLMQELLSRIVKPFYTLIKGTYTTSLKNYIIHRDEIINNKDLYDIPGLNFQEYGFINIDDDPPDWDPSYEETFKSVLTIENEQVKIIQFSVVKHNFGVDELLLNERDFMEDLLNRIDNNDILDQSIVSIEDYNKTLNEILNRFTFTGGNLK